MNERPYPRPCPECGKTTCQPATTVHNGVTVPVDQCTECKAVFFTNATDDVLARTKAGDTDG